MINIALAIWLMTTQVHAANEHPKILYFTSDKINLVGVQPGDDAVDLVQLKNDRRKYFAAGGTCESARKFEQPETAENFFGDLIDDLKLCPGQRKAVTDLLAHVGDDVALNVLPAKKAHARRRPSQDHAAEILPPCPHEPAKENVSFPSLHAAISAAQADALSAIFKAHAADFQQRARDIALSREVLGVHYPSDVAGGAEIGHRVAKDAIGKTCDGTRPCFKTAASQAKSVACDPGTKAN